MIHISINIPIKELNFNKQVAVNDSFNPTIVNNFKKMKTTTNKPYTNYFKYLNHTGMPSLDISLFFKNLDFAFAFKIG